MKLSTIVMTLALFGQGLASQAMADQKTELARHKFTFEIYPSAFQCIEGHHTGHFPTPTELRIQTGLGSSSLTNPSSHLIVNSSYFYYQAPLGKTCAEFAHLTGGQASTPLGGRGEQIFTEWRGKNVYGTCMRNFREDVSIVVGGLTFTGASELIVSPLDESQCAGI